VVRDGEGREDGSRTRSRGPAVVVVVVVTAFRAASVAVRNAGEAAKREDKFEDARADEARGVARRIVAAAIFRLGSG
jgi:hypothetical protein